MYPDSKAHGANMGPICGRQDPGGPHIGPMNFVIWGYTAVICYYCMCDIIPHGSIKSLLLSTMNIVGYASKLIKN